VRTSRTTCSELQLWVLASYSCSYSVDAELRMMDNDDDVSTVAHWICEYAQETKHNLLRSLAYSVFIC
jgi:hypothetical protein